MTSSENICIQFDCDIENLDVNSPRLEALIRAICAEFELDGANIHISIVDDAAITEVHRKFLNKDATTDVISFDLTDEFEENKNFQFVVNAEMAHRQSHKRGHSTEAELALYMTHGMLHNLGYNDTSDAQARRMHEKEDEILQKNGFGIIFNSDETPDSKESIT